MGKMSLMVYMWIRVRVIVLNATFNDISSYIVAQVADKLHHIVL
jgi:hypothetical protein